MKKYFVFLLALLASSAGMAQTTVTGDRVIAKQGLYVVGTWLDSIQKAGAFDNNRTIPTSKAVADYFLTNNNKAKRFMQVGDSIYVNSAIDTVVFFGNSITAGSVSPFYVRYAQRVAAGLNAVEWNFAIGGTTMVQVAAGDSSMQERIYRLPVKLPTRKWLFFGYGANDCGSGSIDTATFRLIYSRVLDSAIIARGWPASNIVLVGLSYIATGSPLVSARDTTFLRITKEVAAVKGVKFVDTRTGMILAGGKTLLRNDLVHPNEFGHQIMAKAVLDTLNSRHGSLRITGYAHTGPLFARSIGNNIPALTLQDTSQTVFMRFVGRYSSSGSSWFGIGPDALSNNTGLGNVGVGDSALHYNTTGQGNTAIGHYSLVTNNGNNNTALGKESLRKLSTGNENTAIGRLALTNQVSGSGNTAVGSLAGTSITTGGSNTAVGFSALRLNTTGLTNTAIGTESLFNNSTSTGNVALGYQSLYWNTGGQQNTAIGTFALKLQGIGSKNTALGYGAFDSVTTGIENVGIGYKVGTNLIDGQRNTFIGYQAGFRNKHGNRNTVIGYYLFPETDSSASDRVVLANGDQGVAFYANTNLNKSGIFNAAPTEALHIKGKVRIDTVTTQNIPDSILTITDGVIEKSSIDALKNVLGLDEGTFSPTTYNGTNVTAATIQKAMYSKTGRVVTVSLVISITMSGSGQAVVEVDPPIPTTFSTVYDVIGTTNTPDVLTGSPGIIKANTSTNKIAIQINNGAAFTRAFWVNFQYEITPP